MFNSNKEITMEIVSGFDHIIEEGQNTSINLRKISWNGREPKLDLRKWSYQDDGEKAMKGITLTEDGGDELACVLVEQGYGDTKRLAKALKARGEDITVNDDDEPVIEDDDSSDPEGYYDPSELFGGGLGE